MFEPAAKAKVQIKAANAHKKGNETLQMYTGHGTDCQEPCLIRQSNIAICRHPEMGFLSMKRLQEMQKRQDRRYLDWHYICPTIGVDAVHEALPCRHPPPLLVQYSSQLSELFV